MNEAKTFVSLNQSAARLVEHCLWDNRLNIESRIVGGATIVDFGVEVRGGLEAGLALAKICLADHGDVILDMSTLDHHQWPAVTVRTDHPTRACLCAQYAGWQIAVDKYFAMGSGPMRAVSRVEPLFEELDYAEQGGPCVGVLESAKLPDEAVVEMIVDKLKIDARDLMLCVAPTSSIAGTVQVVARSVETALHQLHELKFDMRRLISGMGRAPLPPIAPDDLTAIGWTNDAVLYGGSVVLWVSGDDANGKIDGATIQEVGPRIPSSSSRAFGKPFSEIFEAAGGDFYKIDPTLFSPAEITFYNVTTGQVQRFGRVAADIIQRSFGV